MSGVRIPGGRKPTGDHTALSLLLTNLQVFIQDVPILGDLWEIITGKPDANKNDFGSFVNGIVDTLKGLNPFSGFSKITDIFTHQTAVANTATSAASAASSAQSAVTAGFSNLFNSWFGSGGTGTAGQVGQTVSAIKSAIFGTRTVYTLTGSGSFTVPQCTSLWVICINGGGGGAAGSSTNTVIPGALGGVHGGYNARKFSVDALGGVGAVIPYSTGNAGAGGAANGQAGGTGGVSTFGPSNAPLWSGQSGVSAIQGEAGFTASTSIPGSGGDGGNNTTASSGSFDWMGKPGLSGLLGATGGAAGTTRGAAGGNGLPANVTDTPAGGGGGGGGAGNFNNGQNAGSGGAAGGYGSDGGGGGTANAFSNRGNGGNGGPGVIYILAA